MHLRFHITSRGRGLCNRGKARPAVSIFIFFWVLCVAQSAGGSTLLTARPTSLSFGTVTTGSTNTQSVTLTNTGTSSVTVSQATVTGTGFSISGLSLPLILRRRNSATFSATFAPKASGNVTGIISILSNGSNSPTKISLSGTGAAGTPTPAVSLSPASLNFASQAIGTRSGAQAVMLTNTGEAALTVSSLSVTGTNASDFAQTNTCGSSVAAGANCTISVTFTPAVSGTRSAAVTLTDNATGSPQSVSLTGMGTAPLASLSPGSLTFPSQAVGATSAAQAITLTNTGNATLSISGLGVIGTNPSDFAQTNNCGASVAAGANCTISVTFTPAASGTRSAAITLTDNATGSPQSISLTGTGTAPLASLSPGSLTFPSQAVGATSAAQTITLTNTGNATLSISGLTVSGTNAGDFAQSNNCGASVAAGANCTISVTFTPAASGTRSAALTLTDNATGSPQTVTLFGTGTSTGAVLSLSSTSLAFDSQPVQMTSGPQTVTLTNTGSDTLSISGLALTGTNASDFAETGNCGNSIAAGANCTIVVLFTPSAPVARTAALSISDNATGSPQSVSLSGTGTHDVILSWTASATPGVKGYNVYRGTTSGGESSTPLNPTPISGTTYADENVTSGTRYYYVIACVASDGTIQSADSNEAPATVPSP